MWKRGCLGWSLAGSSVGPWAVHLPEVGSGLRPSGVAGSRTRTAHYRVEFVGSARVGPKLVLRLRLRVEVLAVQHIVCRYGSCTHLHGHRG